MRYCTLLRHSRVLVLAASVPAAGGCYAAIPVGAVAAAAVHANRGHESSVSELQAGDHMRITNDAASGDSPRVSRLVRVRGDSLELEGSVPGRFDLVSVSGLHRLEVLQQRRSTLRAALAPFGESVFPHFLSGPLDTRQRLEFLRIHTQRHIHQIARIQSGAEFPR